MKTKKIFVIFASVMLGFFLLGSSGVIHMADDSLDEGFGADDRLIGVVITTEHLDLFDFEGYLEDNGEKILFGSQIDESQQAKYQGRLYATLVDRSYTDQETGQVTVSKEFIFDGVRRIPYFAADISDESGSHYLATLSKIYPTDIWSFPHLTRTRTSLWRVQFTYLLQKDPMCFTSIQSTKVSQERSTSLPVTAWRLAVKKPRGCHILPS